MTRTQRRPESVEHGSPSGSPAPGEGESHCLEEVDATVLWPPHLGTADEEMPRRRHDTIPIPPLGSPPVSVPPEPDDAYEEELARTVVVDPERLAALPPTTRAFAGRSDVAREIYRRFLASDYAPALDLAEQLIANGNDDPLLMTIAYECRVSLERGLHRASERSAGAPVATFDGATTIAEVASITQRSVEAVVRHLERLMLVGRTIRPPSR